MSALGSLYDRVYGALCGTHPEQRPWHFQWLSIRDLRRDLRRTLPALAGAVADVGCGDQPYRRWMAPDVRYTGLDLEGAGARADVVLRDGEPWPLASGSVDAILCTQVLEHAADPALLVGEMRRVLEPGGTLVLSVPFAYHEHGSPRDYRRYTVHGVRALLAPGFDLVELRPQGGVGSTCGVLALNWVEVALNASRATRIAKALCLPAWLALALGVNAAAALLDAIDRTGCFYGNVWAVARRRD